MASFKVIPTSRWLAKEPISVVEALEEHLDCSTHYSGELEVMRAELNRLKTLVAEAVAMQIGTVAELNKLMGMQQYELAPFETEGK